MGASTSTPKQPIFQNYSAPGMGKKANKYPTYSPQYNQVASAPTYTSMGAAPTYTSQGAAPTYNAPKINWQQLAQADILADRPNQSTTWAQNTWTQGPTGAWTQNLSLNPQTQALNNQYAGNAAAANSGQQQALAQYFNLANGQEYKDLMSGSSLPSWDAAKAELGMKSDPSTRLQAQSALMGLADPYNKAARNQMTSQLASQGIDPNSEFAQRQMQQLTDGENRQMLEAIMRGGEEEQRALQMKMAAGQYNIDNTSKIRQGMLSDMFNRLQNPLNNAEALGNMSSQNLAGMGGIQQLSQMPTFMSANGANTRAGENQLSDYRSQFEGNMSTWGANQQRLNDAFQGNLSSWDANRQNKNDSYQANLSSWEANRARNNDSYQAQMDKYNADLGRYRANQEAINNAWKLAYDKASIKNAGAASTNQGISTGVGAASGIAMAAIIA